MNYRYTIFIVYSELFVSITGLSFTRDHVSPWFSHPWVPCRFQVISVTQVVRATIAPKDTGWRSSLKSLQDTSPSTHPWDERYIYLHER